MKLLEILEEDLNMKVLAGEKGIEREVLSVSVMDAPDIYEWMKGGEFLLTSGYIINQNPETTKELLSMLSKSGVAGLGIKLERYISELPKEIIQWANDLNFPIVYIPIDYAWADIINFVLTKVNSEKTEQLILSERIHKAFTNLVIQGGGAQGIVETLSEILDKTIVYYDLFFKNTYAAAQNKNEKQIILQLPSFNFLDSMSKKYQSYPLSIENRLYGQLIIFENQTYNKIHAHEKTAIEHASTVLKLEIQRRISNYRVDQKYYDEFVQDLLLDNINTIEERENRAKLYGHHLEYGLLCLIIDIDNFKERFIYLEEDASILNQERNNIFRKSKEIINKTLHAQTLSTSFSDSLVFLIEPKDGFQPQFIKDIKQVSNDIRKSIKTSYSFTVTVGIGDYKDSLMETHVSYKEAKQTIKIGRMINKWDQTLYYGDLEAYRVLISAAQSKEANVFCNNYLKKLEQYDEINQSSLMYTLDCLVKNDWNMKITAKELYIHYNTIKYRLQNIKGIVGINTLDREQKFIIELYFKLRDLKRT